MRTSDGSPRVSTVALFNPVSCVARQARQPRQPEQPGPLGAANDWGNCSGDPHHHGFEYDRTRGTGDFRVEPATTPDPCIDPYRVWRRETRRRAPDHSGENTQRLRCARPRITSRLDCRPIQPRQPRPLGAPNDGRNCSGGRHHHGFEFVNEGLGATRTDVQVVQVENAIPPSTAPSTTPSPRLSSWFGIPLLGARAGRERTYGSLNAPGL
jgi:hypothetical protein